ncbi:MAG TPA: ATP-binding protein, partial [Gemmatimonadaceae bacterium]|nr:ATP-binding protein [Gemmatimonadaceae bacterium]
MTWLDSLRERSRRTRLGVKLGWLTAGLTALVVFLSFVGLTVRIRGNTRRLFADELARNQRAVARVQRRSLEQLLAEANLVTAVPGVNAVLSEWQQDELQGRPVRRDLANTVNEAFSEYLRRVDKDVLIATDDSGRVVASVVSGGLPLPAGTTLATMPAVRRALDPTAPADSGSLAVLRTPHDVFQVAVFPLVMPDGRTLGAVVLGERLEPGVVKLAQDGFSGQVVVTAGRELVTEPTPSFGEGDIPTLNASAAASGTPGPVTIRGQEAIAAMVDLGRTQDGTPVRLWLLQELAPTVRALTHPVFVDFVVYGLLAVIIAGLGGGLMSRSVLDPLTRFVAFLHSAAGGEPSAARFDAGRASVEVRALNDSFTELMDSLAVKQRQLEHRTEELAAANADLTSEARERRRVELALRESEAQLRQSQKLEAVGTLAGGIAHDFNNLLTVISGYSQLALRRAGSGTEDADDLKQVVDAADRAARLTQQLLAFSRKQVLKPTVLDLAEVAEGVAPMLRRLIGEHIDLRIARDDALARVMADRGQVEQVIINLVVNARDAMPTGGTITIRIANAPDPVDANRPPAGVVLSVRDTGTGIPPEVRERIFEPFFTTKAVSKGTGLGLAVVYGIVASHEGTIDV